MLEVKLIGTFTIKCDGNPVTLSSRAAQSLFAYLILTAGTLHRREKLAGMFWPDTAEEKSRAYLRHELWRIRKALLTDTNFNYLITDDINVSFDANAPYWLDVTLIQNLNGSTSSSDLRDALLLFQGDLLPGFYDEWVVVQREHLQAVYEQKMTRFLELLEGENRWHEILEWAERWISSGQVPETAFQSLMIAYDALGDRAKVASTFERCVQALRQLDLEPSEQTRALVSKRSVKLRTPVPLTSFIGREQELHEVANLLSKSRLVTLTGSGGVGKTRLAIQVVPDVLELFPDGVWFLDLAPLSDPAVLPRVLAEALDLSANGGSDTSSTEFIIGYLRSRKALIILDNCEHLVEACAQLAHSLLTSCDYLSLLATSRESLRVAGEIPYRVPSLELPQGDINSTIEVVAQTESVRLFTERAVVVSPGFTVGPHNGRTVAQICQRLGGIPLAIELAAARTNLLPVDQILKRLDDRFNLLTSGLRSALPRHQTLRATIEWSYDLLSQKERLLFQRLAVFVGGWTLEAAEAVCSGNGIENSEVLDLLSQLVNKSLVVAEVMPEGTRYRRLETIRQFACEKLLVSGEGNQLRKQHCCYFSDLAEQADRETHSPERQKWKDRLEADNDNFRAAFEWCVSERDTEDVLRLLGSWAVNGRLPFKDIEDKFNGMLGLPEVNAYPMLYARMLNTMAGANWIRGNIHLAKSFAEEAQGIWLKLGKTGVAGLAACLEILGASALNEESILTARSFLEKSMELYQEQGNERGVAGIIFRMGHLEMIEGRYDAAAEQYIKALEIWKKFDAVFGVAATSNELGELARLQGKYDQAREFYEKSLEAARKLRDQALLPITLFNSAWAFLHTNDLQRAKDLFKESLDLRVKDGNKIGIIDCLAGLASILVVIGKYEAAARLFGATELLFEASGAGPRDPCDQKEVDHFLVIVREQLDEATFKKAWAEGSEMKIEQVIAFALNETGL